MKKIVIYTTDMPNTDNVLKCFYTGIKKTSEWIPYLIDINEYLKFGFPKKIDAISVFGILRGTGKALLEAKKKGIDSYYFDHSYFDAGYKENHWVRICRNAHSMNYLKDSSPQRWLENFEKLYNVQKWKQSNSNQNNILIIPPTSAICWFFSCHEWVEELLNILKQKLNSKLHSNIKIRVKPNEPLVDINGNFLGIRNSKNIDNISLQEDLENSSIVIAYNSQVALEATIRGIPVIVSENNACHSISFSLNDINSDLNNRKFLNEPKRKKLFNWLSNNQFNLEELKNGFAWEMLNKQIIN